MKPISGHSINDDSSDELIIDEQPLLSKDPRDNTFVSNPNGEDAYSSLFVKPEKLYWEAIFVTIPLFMGYASLFALQGKLKNLYGITSAKDPKNEIFTIAASFVYIGNLVFRIGHNFVFAFLAPRNRVFLSIVSMSCSMLIIATLFMYYGLLFPYHQKLPHFVWAFVAYGLGGVAIGTFESNLLSCIVPLGPRTKNLAILGMPLGVVCITVLSFFVQAAVESPYNSAASTTTTHTHMSLSTNTTTTMTGTTTTAAHTPQPLFPNRDAEFASDIVLTSSYSLVFVALIGAAVAFRARIYRLAVPDARQPRITFLTFVSHLREWRRWLPPIWLNCVALMCDMFLVSLFSPGVLLYVYKRPLPLYINGATLDADWLKAVYNMFFCAGDTGARKLLYSRRRVFPLAFLGLAVVGVACGVSNLIYVVPLCGFFVAFTNGAIYAQSARHIDVAVPPEFNLTATSVWLFVGDVGSVTGSNLLLVVQQLIELLPWFAQ